MKSGFDATPRARPNRTFQHGSRPVSDGPSFKKSTFAKRHLSQPIQPSTNVFLNFIPPSFTENDLRKLCEPYGTIICSKIMINLETGESRCFGFVRFETLNQAQAAIKALNGLIIEGKRLLANYAESHEKKERQTKRIYVKHIPLIINQEYVLHLFSQFGKVIQVIPHHIENQEPQYWRCFIQYDSIDSASNAIYHMNNYIIVPDYRPIHVKYADESRLASTPIVTPPNTKLLIETHNEQDLLPSFLFM